VLAQGSNFSLLMVFFCSVLYKYDSFTNEQLSTSSEQALLRGLQIAPSVHV
jgi:hypothetical protein